ncbi:cyclic AMP-dependent transcription factor ATF-4 isoform X2 [Salarias fasciatus]|uniref:cyclic AMP-dependent transcription factor ATF-4 isoform X2 n=1 Tax=Salarias fasciatus TaxID=181472 RepID=UPI001176AD2B|nr:cyclic AMP-dependent transcription factor ATF-4 isoform X2 [Salarias fasciatus]
MTLSQLALEDVEALCFGHSFLMADPMGPLLDQDEEEALSPSSSLEGKAPASPPLSSFSSSSSASSLSPYQTVSFSPLSSTSPPPSPPPTQSSSFLGTKARADLQSLPWLVAGDLLNSGVGADDSKDDAFDGMDWMSEKIDLSEFDLESLIGSCSSDESPDSPEDLLASFDSHMGLELEPFAPGGLELGLPLPGVPPLPLEPVKSEPLSPAPSSCPPSSPVYTLELGSEVDVLDAEKTTPSVAAAFLPDASGGPEPPVAPIVLSIPSSGHLVVVLSNKEGPSPPPLPDQTPKTSASSDCDSDSGIESAAGSPPRQASPPPPRPTAGSSRTKPYVKPEPAAAPSPKTPKVKSVSGAPKVVEKKLKKMEQNKTAATRYRQKKRVEQELLLTECEELEKRNRELAEKAESISREIQYLKDLMEEVRKHRRGKTGSVA